LLTPLRVEGADTVLKDVDELLSSHEGGVGEDFSLAPLLRKFGFTLANKLLSCMITPLHMVKKIKTVLDQHC
jgi:hypothetical protein